MTNEELVYLIQQGNADKIIELWEQTRKFIALEARRFINNSTFSDYFIEDLEQSGYFALIDAAAVYDPERGASFIHYLTFHLKNAFNEALGIRSEKQANDPIHHAAGLDTPISDKTGDSFSLADIYGSDDLELENVEERVYIDQLRSILLQEIDLLPENQAEIIKEYYWDNKTYAEIAERENCSMELIRQRKAKALRTLRRRSRKSGLNQYIEERTPYYKKVGANQFNRTHTSSVEFAVLKRERLIEKQHAIM